MGAARKKKTTRKKAAKRAPKLAKKPARKKEAEDFWLNKRQMSQSAGVTVQAFTNWQVKPVDSIGRETFFTVEDVLANRIARALSQAKPAPSKKDPGTDDDGLQINSLREKALLDRERRQGERLKNEIRAGKMFPVDAGEVVFSRIGSEIAAILEALPGKLKLAMPNMTATALDDIKRECARARNAAADVGKSFDDYLDEYYSEAEAQP